MSRPNPTFSPVPLLLALAAAAGFASGVATGFLAGIAAMSEDLTGRARTAGERAMAQGRHLASVSTDDLDYLDEMTADDTDEHDDAP